MQHDTTWGVPEEEVQLYCKVLEIKELSFESLRNAFRKACLRHHPKMIEYHLMQYEKRSRFVDVYYSNFHRAVVAYGTLAAMLVVQETNALHRKDRLAHDWSGRMVGSGQSGFGQTLNTFVPQDIVPTLISLQEAKARQGIRQPFMKCNYRASKMLHVFISHTEMVESHTVYIITVIYNMRRHVVRKRYREFLDLKENVEALIDVPTRFPPKKWSKNSTGVLSERAAALSLYIQELSAALANAGMFSQELHEFLHIDTLRIRREEELALVSILDNTTNTNQRKQWFIVDEQWLLQWRAFVQPNADFDPPKTISNERLLLPNGIPNEKMKIITDYRCVNGDVWALWEAIYGGGPAIVRGSKDLLAPALYGCQRSIHALQRLTRQVAKMNWEHKQNMTIGDYLALRHTYVYDQKGLAISKLQQFVRKHVLVQRFPNTA